jgi:hypothetical protein
MADRYQTRSKKSNRKFELVGSPAALRWTASNSISMTTGGHSYRVLAVDSSLADRCYPRLPTGYWACFR